MALSTHFRGKWSRIGSAFVLLNA